MIDVATFFRLAAARIEANGGSVPDELARAVLIEKKLPPKPVKQEKAVTANQHIQNIIKKKFFKV